MAVSRSESVTNDEYRRAVAIIVRALQKTEALSDRALAERIGCSPGTIRNARSEATSLDPMVLVRIELEFGPGAIDPFLELANVRAVGLVNRVTPIDPVLALVEALHRLVEAQSVDSMGGKRITNAELVKILHELRKGRAALDALIARAEHGRI